MASLTFVKALSTQYELTPCASCNNPVALPSDWIARLRREGRGFWCPYCGKQTGWRESDADRLKKELARAKEAAEREQKWRMSAEAEVEHGRRSKAAYKGQLTRVKRKVANGSCPCCMRHFVNLERHMKTKHPEYVEESNREPRDG